MIPNEESNFRQHQETARNTERLRLMHRGRGDKEHESTTWDRQDTGPPVEDGRGGRVGMRVVEAGRERDGTLDRRTLGPIGT